MSHSMHLFLSTGLAPHDAAQRLAEALGGEAVEHDGNLFVATRLEAAEVGGEIARNIYGAPPDPEPDEISVLDGYDIAFEIRRVPFEEDARRAAARRLFDEIVERLRWPVLLVDNLDILIAAWHPSAGRTDFPAGTTPDAQDEELWRRYAITPS